MVEISHRRNRVKRAIKEVLGTLLVIAVFLFFSWLVLAIRAEAGPPNSNNVGYWCESQEAGVKYTPIEPFVVPEPPTGYIWTLLVIKAGSTGNSVDEENFVVQNPVVGNVYAWEGTWQGEPVSKAISHVILCVEASEQTTTTTSTTTTVVTTTTPESSTTTETATTSTTSSTTVPTTTAPTTTQPSAVPTTTDLTTTEPPPVGGVPAGGGAMAASTNWNWLMTVGVVLLVVGLLLAMLYNYLDSRKRGR
jgi:hypothetical protein